MINVTVRTAAKQLFTSDFLFLPLEGVTKNTHFLEQVSRIFGKDDEIIVVRPMNGIMVSNK